MPQAIISTPASTGVNMEVKFLPDQTLQLYHNGALVQNQTYHFWQPPNSPDMHILEINDRTLQPNLEEGPVTIQGDSLIISGGYNDAGATQTWRRVE